MDDAGQRVEQAIATVEAVWTAYEAGTPEFFEFFTEDVSIFSLSFPNRLQGREAYKRYFGQYFLEQRRAAQILHPEVRLIGDAALVSYHCRVRVNYNSVDNRTTLLLVPDGGRLKIAHMHMSPLAVPQPTEAGGLVEDIAAVWTVKDSA